MAEKDYERLLVARRGAWDIYLHSEQQYLGRCYAALRSREAVDPFCLPPKVQEELAALARELRAALDSLFRPELINYANLRNTWPVCHWHIIPRYDSPREFAGFTFEDRRRGLNYAPYDGLPKPDDDVVIKIRDVLRAELVRT